MAYTMRHAALLDLLKIAATRRRQRVLRLHPHDALVHPEAVQLDLWKSQLPLHMQSSFVYMCEEDDSILGYVQARSTGYRRDEWVITTLAAGDKTPRHIWEALIEGLVQEAGEREVLRLSVKVPQGDPRLEDFMSLGFTRYTTERIWGKHYFGSSGAPSDEPQRGLLRRQTNRDAWDLMRLYWAVTPPAVQRAEDLHSRQWQRSQLPRLWPLGQGPVERSFVWPDESGEKDRLGGNIRLLTGSRGHWISLLFRPDRANRDVCSVALDYVLWKAVRLGNKPVYCGVREYQVEAESLLEERGFHPLSEQDLLVKYLAEPIKTRQNALVPFLVPKRREMITTK